MSLYTMIEELEVFQSLVENGDIPEEAIDDTLSALNVELDTKIENIAFLIKNMTAESDAIKHEIESLKARMDAKVKTVDRLKAYLTNCLTELQRTKFETSKVALSFRKSEKVIISDTEKFAEEHRDLCKEKIEVTPDKTLIKKLVRGGLDIEGVTIEVSQNLQVK